MGKMNELSQELLLQAEWEMFEDDRKRHEGKVEFAKELLADVERYADAEPDNHYVIKIHDMLVNFIENSKRADV